MTVQALREMIAADLLKLRKKRSVAGWALVLTAGISIAFYAYLVIAHATDARHHGPAGGLRHFVNAFSTLGLDFGTIAAILIGVEAGAGETADGIFRIRDLAATGRSRLASRHSRPTRPRTASARVATPGALGCRARSNSPADLRPGAGRASRVAGNSSRSRSPEPRDAVTPIVSS